MDGLNWVLIPHLLFVSALVLVSQVDLEIRIIPEFLDRPTVLGIGEIGLNKNTRNEITTFEEQEDLAARRVRAVGRYMRSKYSSSMRCVEKRQIEDAIAARIFSIQPVGMPCASRW